MCADGCLYKINSIVALPSQCVYRSNRHTVYFKYIIALIAKYKSKELNIIKYSKYLMSSLKI